MKVEANISMGAVVRAMAVPEFAGAMIKGVRITVSYRNDDRDGLATFMRKGGDRLCVQRAEVDAASAIDAMTQKEIEALPDQWWVDASTASPDDGDLHDFIIACLSGDRRGAVALIPRLFNGGNALTAEAALLRIGRAI